MKLSINLKVLINCCKTDYMKIKYTLFSVKITHVLLRLIVLHFN